MAANMAAISDFTKIQIYRKMWKLEIFFLKVVKYKCDTFNSLLLPVAIYVFFSPIKAKNAHLYSKMA